MANAFGMEPQPQSPGMNRFAVGQALMQRRMAMNPTQGQPLFQPGASTMRGVLPAIGQRLLRADPGQMQTPQTFGAGVNTFGGQ